MCLQRPKDSIESPVDGVTSSYDLHDQTQFLWKAVNQEPYLQLPSPLQRDFQIAASLVLNFGSRLLQLPIAFLISVLYLI